MTACKNTVLEWKYVLVTTMPRLTTTSNLLNNADTVKGEILRFVVLACMQWTKTSKFIKYKKI